MIQISGLKIRFKDRYVLKGINVLLPSNGLIGIVGDSGSGKTTFLNCIANLLHYEGVVCIDGLNISQLKEKEKTDYRLRNIGYIFQDFKLFESETIEQNIIFPLECINISSKSRKNRTCDDLLDIVQVKKNKNLKVKDLSGGEKQRIAIARALINNPKIILADEPTGNLDNANSIQIMEILSKISSNSLVFVVSHDYELLSTFADVLIGLKDGAIEKIDYLEKEKSSIFLPIARLKEEKQKTTLKTSFLIRHSKQMFKTNKIRNRISTFVTSLGLICIGLSFSISRLISNSVKSMYSSIIDTNKIMVYTKDTKQINESDSGAPLSIVERIARNYQSYIDDIGVFYDSDFENMFPQCNEFRTAEGAYSVPIGDLSIRNVNEFDFYDFENEIIYPSQIDVLNNDQLILGLNMPSIERICYALKIERTLTSLSNYLTTNTFHIVLDVKNDEWSYSDQQIFEVKGFELRQTNCILHSNRRWNEYVLENQMRFPTSEKNNGIAYPWIIEKAYYLNIFNGRDKFLEAFYSDVLSDNVRLEIANSTQYPILYKNINEDKFNRILCYKERDSISLFRYSKYIKEISDKIHSPVYGTNSSYSIYPEFLMMGFNKPVYCAMDKEIIDDIEDNYKIIDSESNFREELPEYAVSGHYSKTMQEGLIFQSFASKNAINIKLNGYDEIVISSKLASQIGHPSIGEKIQFLFTISEIKTADQKLHREFKRVELKVVGIIDSNKLSIYHYPFWTIGFFQSKLGIPMKELKVNTICYECSDEKQEELIVEKIKKSFPQFEVKNPMKDINSNVDEICSWITAFMIVCSITSSLIAVLILTISNYLNAIDNRHDIGLARCIGLSKKESSKLIYFQSIYSCLISFGLAAIELLALNFVSSYELSKELSNNFVFQINLLPYAVMFGVAMLISILSSWWICKKANKLDTLDCLKT